MILDDIVEKRKEQLQREKDNIEPQDMKEMALNSKNKNHGFKEVLKKSGLSVISEVKKASPSKGVIAEDFRPVEIAIAYEDAGAAAISCLTEEHYFKGGSKYFADIRAKVDIPMLRKDFIFDEYQIYEAKVLGADAILLIAAILSEEKIKEFYDLAKSLEIDCLVEVHNEKELKKSSVIAIVWDILSLTAACFIGIIGRAYLLPTVLGENGASSSESVFIEMINKLFSSHLGLPFIGGIFLCGILAAIMSTADSQLLVTASAASEDLYHQFIKKDADSKEILAVARLTVIVVSVLAFVIAWNPNSSIMGLVSNAWAGLGAAFGPTVVMSLFWRRTNLAGAVAGIVSGGLTVIVWDYIPFAAGQTLGSYTGLYSLAVGFAVSLVMIIIFSLATKAPSKEITDVFDKVTGK